MVEMFVHQDRPLLRRAVKLIDDLAGASPASASFPVGTVVISGDGAGDQTDRKPGCKRPRRLGANPVCSDRRASQATGIASG